jgi:multicomponent Na+:H+ antiporter subunit E
VHTLTMTATLILFWLLMSFDFGTLSLALGIASAFLVVVISTSMDVIDHESQPIHMTARLPLFWAWLGRQVVRSNLDVTRRIWTPGRTISPTVVRVKSSQTTALGKVIYANSITLTPGTVTLSIEGDELLVHALTREDAQTLQQGEMDRRVSELEGGLEG